MENLTGLENLNINRHIVEVDKETFDKETRLFIFVRSSVSNVSVDE